MANYKKWTDAELNFINENIREHSDEQVASQLSKITGSNITCDMVRRQRRQMGIMKKRGRKPKNQNIQPLLSGEWEF